VPARLPPGAAVRLGVPREAAHLFADTAASPSRHAAYAEAG
jgi:class 3 adenylate cyclase